MLDLCNGAVSENIPQILPTEYVATFSQVMAVAMCLSVTSHLTSAASVCRQNADTYSAGIHLGCHMELAFGSSRVVVCG